MKFLIVFSALFAVSLAALLPQQQTDSIVRYENDNIGVDGYRYNYETSNGQSASEQAHLKNVGTDAEAIEVTGEYSYIGDDGVTYNVKYIANENGFQPQGAHLPVA